jgi:methylated-DNA-[protein]-cysteine S-methyltransferase
MTRDRPKPSALVVETMETPIGGLFLVADGEGALCAADFADCEARMRRLLGRRFGTAAERLRPAPIPPGILSAFQAYFAGNLQAIDGLGLETGGTAFQDTVWAALRTIPPGRALTYAALAGRLGRPRSARAVGHANGANPFSIVVPCHRLVGADGSLTGYAGGLPRKRWLLDHEARHAQAGA